MPTKKPSSPRKAPKITASKTKTLKQNTSDFLLQVEEEKNMRSIISYVTIVGWLIAYFGMSSRDEAFDLFHLRQSLGLHLSVFVCEIFSFILAFILPLIWIAYIVALVVFAIGAREGKKTLLPGI